MSEQIYEHLPKWRRAIRDLAVEAGIRKFVNPPDAHDKKSCDDANSSKPIQAEVKK
jgi:hypothetical protein